MLSYQPPFMDVGNLTIFKDDTDPETFYYANIQPAIVQNAEGPSLAAYTILPESSTDESINQVIDSSLSMEVSLGVSEEILDVAIEQIKEQWGKNAKRLLPVTVTDGKVYLILASAGEEPDPKEWYVSSGISPSIFGDNRAALVVKTSGEEAKRLVAALNEDMVAGHVYYEMNMLGIAPTFKARLRVKWDRIYKHFEDMKVKNFIFAREEISNTFDELKESSLVEMEIEELDPDVSQYASKALLDELKTEAVKNLFKPSVPPLSASQKIENRIAHGVGMIHSSIIPGSHYILRNNKEIQSNELIVDLRERKAKKYPFYPQALLSTMIQKAGGLHDRLKWIKLDDLPFRPETITADLAADTFTIANIRSVKIDCEVWDQTLNKKERDHTFIFDGKDKLKGTFKYTRQHSNVYRYRYRATIYINNEGTGLPSQMEVDWQDTESEFIYFNPSEYFENTKLQIGIDDTSIFEHTHLIETKVTVREKKSNKKVLTNTFLLEADKEKKEPHLLSLLHSKLHPVKIDLRVVYYIPGSEEFTLELPDHEDFSFFIPNPFENKWTVELMSNADWEQTGKMIVETRIWDNTRGVWITDKFNFTKEQHSHQLGVVTSLDTPKENLEYRNTVIKNNSDVVRGPWTDHKGPILMVKDTVKPARSIKVMLAEAPDFEEFEIKELSVNIIYVDEDNNFKVNSDDNGKLVFRKVGDVVRFTHELKDPSLLAYKYRYKVRSESGDNFRSDWVTSEDEKIEITVPETIW
ncbi:MAG: hypothetical protein AAGD88_01125 [Bacteroidota bacterium]